MNPAVWVGLRSLAVGVDCDLLGVPEKFRAAFRSWSLARSSRPGATAQDVYGFALA